MQERARNAAAQPVGEWPGHDQEVLETAILQASGAKTALDLHFCRVEDAGTGGPLVLLVLRPTEDAVLDDAITKATRMMQPRAA